MKKWQIQNRISLLSDILDITENDLDELLNTIDKCYEKMVLPKKTKKEKRIIYRIKSPTLIKLQKRLINKFFSNVYTPSNVFGFKKGSNYLDYLTYHKTIGDDTYFLRVDVKNFFNSIRIDDFKASIKYYISDECDADEQEKIIDTLIKLTTFKGHFVQGASTSPIISNLVFRPLDIRIEKYCFKMNIKYSRYADDLLFSSNSSFLHSDRFIRAIISILSDRGFSINQEKTLKEKGKLSINGYVVDETVHLSRKKLKEINKILFIIEKDKAKATKTTWGAPNYTLLNYLCGYRAFLVQLLKYGDDNKKSNINITINRIEQVIEKYF